MLIFKRIDLYLACGILLYISMINLTFSHWYEIRLDYFLANMIRIGFFGVLLIVFSGLILRRIHSFIVLLWLVLLLAYDIFRSDSSFILQNFLSISVASTGIALCISLYMGILKKAFQKNRYALKKITNQKELIKRKASELESANHHLKELQQQQNDLINMIIHDMKNPLNVILNYSRKKITESKRNQIFEGGRQLLVLVENILDVHRMEHTRPEMKFRTESVHGLINSSLKQVELLLIQKSIAVKINCDRELFVSAQRDIVERVLVNLLTNAIKFSPINSRILISAELEGDVYVVVHIKDNGKGISIHDKEKVFEKFFQVISRKSGLARSAGIGLAFCRMSIEYMGGRIWISDTSRHGTTFSFTLPMSGIAPAEGHELSKIQEYKRDLSLEDKRILMDTVVVLKDMELYKAGQIFEKLSLPAFNENSRLRNWVNEVRSSVCAANKKLYHSLLDQVLT
jgi:signal transduction histidine kinase